MSAPFNCTIVPESAPGFKIILPAEVIRIFSTGRLLLTPAVVVENTKSLDPSSELFLIPAIVARYKVLFDALFDADVSNAIPPPPPTVLLPVTSI